MKIAIIFSNSILYVIDILRSNDAHLYQRAKENLETQEASILKTNSEISKDLIFYENEIVKYDHEKTHEDYSKNVLKESDFVKLEKYEILKKFNENLKLELTHIKEKWEMDPTPNKMKPIHMKTDSLKYQLEECVCNFLHIITIFLIFDLILVEKKQRFDELYKTS